MDEAAKVRWLAAITSAQQWVLGNAIGMAFDDDPEGLNELERRCGLLDDAVRTGVVARGEVLQPGADAIHETVLAEIQAIFRIARAAAGVGTVRPRPDR